MNPLTVNPIIAIAYARAENEREARRRSGRRDRAITAARMARKALERSGFQA
jgi:hypothetical protein